MTCDELRECLLDYVEGTLAADRGGQIRAHISSCQGCAARLRSTKELVGDLSAARSIDRSAATIAFSSPGANLARLSILGDFEIQEELGRGGMGVVYRARQLSLNRIVALKVLSGAGLQNERAIARFQKEAQAAARLHHTNIVPIYAQGHEQGCFFYAMELIDGRSLDKVLQDADAFARKAHLSGHGLASAASSAVHAAQSAVLGGHRAPPRDFKRIARLLAEVADALQHAHDQGIVHRDIKPQNLLLGGDDHLHITDFGLARILDEPGLTLTTEIVGTPAYMSPEQLRSGTPIDARADIYALGVTFYELLTHQRPFQAETYERLIHTVLNKEPRPPRKLEAAIPIDLETICLRAMEKEPGRRFASAGEMARDLRRYADDFPIASRRIGPLGRIVRWVRRNPIRAAAIGSVAIIAVLVPILFTSINANANARCEQALSILLENYTDERRVQEAAQKLGWARNFGGDRSRAELVGAFLDLAQQKHEQAYKTLEDRVARDPLDADAQYLLAWACERRALGGGPQYWEKLRLAIAAGDAHQERATGEGLVFRGLAAMQYEPELAFNSFRKARERLARDQRPNSAQALWHEARVSNQVLYCLRDEQYYTRTVDSLTYICESLQPTALFPRYLLSVACRIRAEIKLEREAPSDDDKAIASDEYDRALKHARRLRELQPEHPRYYTAIAEYHESRAAFENTAGHLRDALQALDEMQANCSENLLSRPRVRVERFSCAMRYAFILGDFSAAKQAHAQLYHPDSGHDPTDPVSLAEANFFAALIAASANERSAARALLDNAAPQCKGRAEAMLALHAAYRLIGFDPPADYWSGPIDCETQLQVGWTPSWTRNLVDFARGSISFRELSERAKSDGLSETHLKRRMSAAHFYHAVQLLASGDRAAAEQAFDDCWHTRDFENYCFRGKLLCLRMRLDPAWPAWISTGPRPLNP